MTRPGQRNLAPIAWMSLALAMVAGLLSIAVPPGGQPAELYRAGRYAQALQGWLPTARQGDPIAQNRVAIQYHLGLGVERDYATAARWYGYAALSGNANARRNLGLLFENGLGVEQDPQLAYAWYVKALEVGHPRVRSDMDRVALNLTPNMIIQSRRLITAAMEEMPQTPASE